MTVSLAEKCEQNRKDIDKLFNIVNKLVKDILGDNKPVDTIIEIEEEIPPNERLGYIENSMVDTTMDRRIDLHKKNNTYREVDPNIPNIPTITPLHTLTHIDREMLERKIFHDAVFNVEMLLGIKRSDSDFKTKVCEESDRLLDIWNEQHKIKK